MIVETLRPRNDPPLPPDWARSDTSLFLDFDGTLVDLAPRPDDVVIDAALRTTLAALAAAAPGRVAIVSGRSLATLDALLGADLAAALVLAGSHGVELRAPYLGPGETTLPPGLAAATAELAAVADAQGLLFEGKTCGAALHFRQAPALAAKAAAAAADVAARYALTLQHGKMMVEVRVPGDKGAAVERLMATPPMRGTRPLMLGDDVTDEAGFAAAARLGGAGVLVGEHRASAARYALPDVAAVRAWLTAFAEKAA